MSPSPSESAALRIAAAATPDEVDVAPAVLDAFLSGRAGRREALRRGDGPLLGGFGLPGGGEFAVLLDSMVAVAETLSLFLTLGMTGSELVGRVLRARERRAREKLLASVPAEAVERLQTASEGLVEELVERDVEPDRARELVRRTLGVMLEEPEESERLLRKLSAAKG